jgi:hypothetical protein
MAIHPLAIQLRFARSEFVRCVSSVSAEDAVRRVQPMNCISWMAGHLANQEQHYWVRVAQGRDLVPGLNDLVGYGKPASSPPLEEMWAAWNAITQAADEFLDGLATERLLQHLEWNGKRLQESIGTMLLRNLYHYWFHTGEAHAVRQLLGHTGLPDFVGDMSAAWYRPEE